jgi:hypothetical protein
MPEMLQPAAATQTTPELLAAAYFQTIAMANAGWGPR